MELMRDIQHLQEILLEAVVGGRPLPGGVAVTYPDAPFLLRQPEVFVEDRNLHGSLSKRVRVLSANAIQREAQSREVVYLRFEPPAIGDDEVTLTLRGMITSAERTAALSTVQVTFRRDGGEWRAPGPPTYSAA
jgi:hypothetical protein